MIRYIEIMHCDWQFVPKETTNSITTFIFKHNRNFKLVLNVEDNKCMIYKVSPHMLLFYGKIENKNDLLLLMELIIDKEEHYHENKTTFIDINTL